MTSIRYSKLNQMHNISAQIIARRGEKASVCVAYISAANTVGMNSIMHSKVMFEVILDAPKMFHFTIKLNF
eukprot:2602026-Amphidinium_carterae.1